MEAQSLVPSRADVTVTLLHFHKRRNTLKWQEFDPSTGSAQLGSLHRSVGLRREVPNLTLWENKNGSLPKGWEARLASFLEKFDPERATPAPGRPLRELIERHNVPSSTATPAPTQTAKTGATKSGTKAAANEKATKNKSAKRKAATGERPVRKRKSPQQVFVSYSRDDRAYVDRLVAHLASAGLTLWIDKSGIDYGTRWEKEIRTNLDACAVFVVVMTPAGEESEWVEREIMRARKLRKPIQPLLLKGAEFFGLSNMQYESVVGGKMPSDKWVEQVKRLVAVAEP